MSTQAKTPWTDITLVIDRSSSIAGIRTNLLFFTKGAPTQDVWYYEHPYPPGAKSYNKGKPIRIEEFEAERAWWGEEHAPQGGLLGLGICDQSGIFRGEKGDFHPLVAGAPGGGQVVGERREMPED